MRYLLTVHSCNRVSSFTDAFVTAMERHGFPGLSAFDIVKTGMQVREEMAITDPKDASAL
jgi:hypothetical protein